MKQISLFKKVKFIVTFLTLFSGLQLLQAQEKTIQAKVVNNNGKPLVGATIKSENSSKGTATDFNGMFTWKANASKIEKLIVSYIGYQNAIISSEQLQKNQVITLLESKEVLDEILVSSVRVDKDAPVTHSNLSKEQIAKRNLGQDIPVLLNYLPSVFSSSDAGAGVGYTYLNVRGSDATRVNVTINGIPYNDAESQGTFWVNLGDFASSVENLQLQRGVGTSTNGSGAFGASLNILTDAVSEKAYGEIANSFGSFGTRKHTLKFSTGKLNDHLEFSGRLSNIYSDGYVDRAYTDLKSYFLQTSYTNDNTLIKAIAFGGKEKTYQAWYGLTPEELKENRRQNPYTYDNEVDDYQQNHYQLHWNQKFNNRWTTNLGLNYTKGAGFFEQFKDEESAADFNNLIADESDVIVRRWLDNDFYVANFNAIYKSQKLEINSGVSYSHYTGDHFGEVIWGSDLTAGTNIRDRYYFSDAKKTDFSIFSKATFAVGNKLTAFIDLQGRFVGYETAGLTSDRVDINVDTDFNFFNPKFGLTYRLNAANSFYTSFAVANKEPNRNDFENGVNQHETLNDFELGYRLNNNKAQLNANVYYMNYQNQLVLTGNIDDVGAPIRANSGSSYRLGLELDAQVQFNQKFSVRPTLALSQNRNRDFFATINGELKDLGNTPLTFSPNIIAGNALVFKANNRLQLSFLSKYVGKQYMSNLNSSITDLDVLDSFFTNDLNLVYSFNPKGVFDSVVLTGLVNNIFDVKYVDRGYYYTYDDDWSDANTITTLDGAGYYPQAGINFLVGLTLKF